MLSSSGDHQKLGTLLPGYLLGNIAAATAGGGGDSSRCRHYLLRVYVPGTREHVKILHTSFNPHKNSKRLVLLFFHFTNEK